jgi:hypothetical protein
MIGKFPALITLLGGVFTAVIFNTLFMWRVPGLATLMWALSVILLIQIGKWLRWRKFYFHINELLYLPLSAVATATLLTQNWTINFWATLTTWILSGVVASLVITRQSVLNLHPIYVWQMWLRQLFGGIFGVKKLSDVATTEMSSDAWSLVLKVIKALLVTVPIVGIFFFLLMGADMAFAKLFQGSVNGFDLYSRIVEIITLCVIASMVATSLWKWSQNNLAVAQLVPQRKFEGIGAMILLVMLNILFGLFVAVQFVYLFGGSQVAWTLDIPYSKYAVDGFNQLVVVAILVAIITIAIRLYGFFRTSQYDLILKGLNITLLSLTGVMLVSAWQRISLYIHTYGQTELRLFTQLVIVFLGLILIYLALSVISKHILSYLFVAGVSFSCMFLFTAAAINPEFIIARTNLNQDGRYGVELDMMYLLNDLTSDAYVELLEYQGFRKEYVHCEVIRHWEIESRYRQDLRSFTLTRLANNYRVEYAKAKNPCNANTYHSSR